MSMPTIEEGPDCEDCGKHKMRFASESEALHWIADNVDDMRDSGGHAPSRAYFCEKCNAWHITSRPTHEEVERQIVNENISDAQRVAIELDVVRKEFYTILEERRMLGTFKSCLVQHGGWECELSNSQKNSKRKMVYDYLKRTEPIAWLRLAFPWSIMEGTSGYTFDASKWKAVNDVWQKTVARRCYALSSDVTQELSSMTPEQVSIKMNYCCPSQEFDLAKTKEVLPRLCRRICVRLGVNPSDYGYDTSVDELLSKIEKKSVKVVGNMKDVKSSTKASVEKSDSNKGNNNNQKETSSQVMAGLGSDKIKSIRQMMADRAALILEAQKSIKAQCDSMKGVINTWAKAHPGHKEEHETMLLVVDQQHNKQGSRLHSMSDERNEWSPYIKGIEEDLRKAFDDLGKIMSSIDEQDKKAAEEKAEEENKKKQEKDNEFRQAFHARETNRNDELKAQVMKLCKQYSVDYNKWIKQAEDIHGKMLTAMWGMTIDSEIKVNKAYAKAEESGKELLSRIEKEFSKPAKPESSSNEEEIEDDLDLLGTDTTAVDVTNPEWIHLFWCTGKKGNDECVVTLNEKLWTMIEARKFARAQVARGKQQGAVYIVFSDTGTCGLDITENGNDMYMSITDMDTMKNLFSLLKVQSNDPQNWRIAVAEKKNDIRIKFIERV